MGQGNKLHQLPLVFVGRGVAKVAAAEDQRAEDEAADAQTHGCCLAGGQALDGGTVRTQRTRALVPESTESTLSGWQMLHVSAE